MKQILFCVIQLILLVGSSIFILSAHNKQISWLKNDQQIFISYVVLGVVLCSIGILFRVVGPYKYTQSSQWLSVLTIISGILGVLALVDIYFGFAKKQFIYVKDYASASEVLAVVIVLKIVCSLVKAVLNK